jgi:hypothetical protein
MYGYD